MRNRAKTTGRRAIQDPGRNDGWRPLRWMLPALLVAVAASGAAWADSWSRSVDAGGADRLVVDADQGSVTVVGTGGGQVRISIESRSGNLDRDYEVRLDDSGGEIRLTIDKKRRSSWGFRKGIDIDIEIPAELNVEIDTAGGSISVESVDGMMDLDTSGGSIDVTDAGSDVFAGTSGGSIEVRGVRGELRADTSGGRITAVDIDGAARVATSGGSIRVESIRGDVSAETSGGGIRALDIGGQLLAETSGGSIVASLTGGNDRGGELSTSGGGVTVRLDPSVSLEIDASTSGGSVSTDVPMEVRGKMSRSRVVGTIGGGGATLRLRASGGSIRIERN